MRFRHSGKLGDIVYSLAAVQEFPGSHYYIRGDGEWLSARAASTLLPLLADQPYIESAKLWEGEPFNHDFDEFRKLAPSLYNLADCHLFQLSLPISLRNRSWLTVKEARRHGDVKILFSRTDRYLGSPGVMSELFRCFGRGAAFVGTEAEYQRFCREFGPLHYIKTSDLLELAQVIAGCQLLIANQSCPLAIAEGLKIPVIQEVCHSNPNCLFYREKAFPIWRPEQLQSLIPEISALLATS